MESKTDIMIWVRPEDAEHPKLDRLRRAVRVEIGPADGVRFPWVVWAAGLADLTLLPGTRVTGETVRATLELIGYMDPASGQPRIPRRPLDPGSEVLGVDFEFLRDFYRFEPGNPGLEGAKPRFVGSKTISRMTESVKSTKT